MKTIQNIIREYGGAKALSDGLGGKPGVVAVSKWYRSGIPERYWDTIIAARCATIEELHFLNKLARRDIWKAADVEKVLWEMFNNEEKTPSTMNNNQPQEEGASDE